MRVLLRDNEIFECNHVKKERYLKAEAGTYDVLLLQLVPVAPLFQNKQIRITARSEEESVLIQVIFENLLHHGNADLGVFNCVEVL